MGAVRAAGRIAFWTVVPLLALAFSVWLHFGLSDARVAAKGALSAFLQQEVRGSLRIGHLEVLSPTRIVARDVVVRDDRGRIVATADRVIATPDLAALIHGEVHFTTARLEGGHVRLYFDEGDLPTLITAFQPKHPGGPPGHPPHVLLDDVRLYDVHVAGDVPGMRNLEVEHVQAGARVESTHGNLDLRVRWLTGHVRSPLRPPADITALRMAMVTGRSVDLDVATRNDAGDSATAHLVVGLAETRDVDLVVHTPHLSPETLTGAGVPGLERVRGPVRGWAHLHGVPPELRFESDLEHDGGRAIASGTLGPHAIEVTARTEGLALDRVVTGAPQLRVAARGTLHVDRTEDGTGDPTFRVDVDPFDYDHVAVPGLRAEGSIARTGGVHLSRVASADGSISGEGEVGTDGAIRFRIRGHFPDVRSEPTIHRALPQLRGTLDADLWLARAVDQRWDVHGHAALARAGQGALHAGGLVFDGRLSGDLARPTVAATLTARNATFSGFAIGSGRARVTGGPRNYRAVASFSATGGRTIALDARAERTGDTIIVSAPTMSVAFGATTWRGEVQNIRIRPDHEVGIGLVRVANGSQRLEVRGAYRFHAASDIDAQLQDLDLTLLRSIFGDLPVDLAGRADAHVVLHGDMARPDLEVDGALREGRIGKVEHVGAVYSVQIVDGSLQVDGQLDLGARGTFAVSGTAVMADDRDLIVAALNGAYDGRIDVDRFDLAAIAAMLDDQRLLGLDGDASGRVDITGTRERPTIDALLQIEHVPVPESPELAFTTNLHWENDLVHGSIDVTAESDALLDTQIDAEVAARDLNAGTFDWHALLRDGPWAIQASVPAVRLDQLPEPWRSRVHELPVRVDAEIAARNGPEGSSATITGSATWLGDTSHLPCGRGTAPRVDVTAELEHDQVQAHARGFLRPPESAVDADATAIVPVGRFLATLAAPDTWPAISVHARAPAVELGEVPFACETTTGRLSAQLNVENALTEQPSGRLVAHIEDLRVNDGVPAIVDFEATASSHATVADATFDFQDGGHTDLQVMAESTWGPASPYPTYTPDLRFQMQAGFQQTHGAPLLVFVPGITDADAIVDGQMQAQGTRDQLDWSGRLTLHDGHLELTGPGQRIDDFEAELLFHDQRADLPRLVARDTDGHLRANGWIDFAGILPSSSTLHVSLDKWPVRKEGLVLATASGSADVGARVHHEHSDLTVTVRSLTVNLPDDTLPALQALEPNGDIVVLGERTEEEEAATRYPVHIDVDARNPFWVRRQDFAAEISSRLNVTYESPELFVGGWVRLRRGWFELYGKRFDLQRGSMVFDGSTDLDPEVDLAATFDLPGNEHHYVAVSVSGRMSDPVISFSSNDPAATDQGSILALLVSGRTSLTAASQQTSSGDSNAAILNDTRAFLTGVVLGLATVSLRREFGDVLPMLSIDTGANGNARVRAGIQADTFIREHMQWLSGVVQSAYIEGFVSSGPTDAQGTPSTSASSSTTSGPGGGFRIELGFPNDFVGSVTYTTPANFGLDVTWEP